MSTPRVRSLVVGFFGLAVLVLVARGQSHVNPRCQCLTPEQRAILSRMELVMLDDGMGGTAPTVRFSGVNVQVVNGLGATNGHPADPSSIDPFVTRTNAVGNLVVGYNELGNFSGDDRTGSHNLVVGAFNKYGSFGGQVFGEQNRSTAPYAGVIGGRFNWANAPFSNVSGGDSNQTQAQYAKVCGGEHNFATGFVSVVLGGFGNVASGDFSAVSGGANNTASNSTASVSGGALNTASGPGASLAGGHTNTASGAYSSVSGGQNRSVDGEYDWRAGTSFEED